MILPGAGYVIQIPLSDTCTETAYLVQPASHAGRVVTGVILVHSAEENIFCHSAITFADKLAEQAYKVIIVRMKISDQDVEDCRNREKMGRVAEWFRVSHDIQRLAAIGFEEGADAVFDLNDVCDQFDCFVAISPIGLRSATTWTPKLPTLIVVGEKSSFCHTAQVDTRCILSHRT